MFKTKSKLDNNLKIALDANLFKTHRVIVKCKSLFPFVLKKISSFKDSLIYPIESCNIISCHLNKKELLSLIEYPEVEYICFDEFLSLCGSSVASANKYHRTSANLNLSGKGITIGIVDSGVYPHIDLTRPFNSIIFFKDLLNDLSHPYDDNGHGTAMAGIISGSGTSSNDLYSGIAKESKIASIKAFDSLGKGYASTVLYGIELLLKESRKHNIKVLCLPFEMLSYNATILNSFSSIFEMAKNLNVIPVVPSGSINSSIDSLNGIALLKNCITVSGVILKGSQKPYKYSPTSMYSKTKKPNFACACSEIICLNSDTSYVSEKNGLKIYPKALDAKYKTFSGTSISSAFVSAICALLFEHDSTLNIDDIIAIISLCSFNPDDLDINQIGLGVINLNKLLK